MTANEAADRSAAVLSSAEALAKSERQDDREKAQALTWVADSWTRLAEAIDEHPRISTPIA